MSRCSILWSLKNIRKDINDSFTLDSTQYKIPEGYYTFTELQTELKKHKITITRLQNNHVTITSEKLYFPGKMGTLLGFLSDERLEKDTLYTSTFEAKMTNGLKEIDIYSSSLIDEYRNYEYLGNNIYGPSSLLVNLNIDTSQSLDGTITNFSLDNTKIPLSDFSGQDIEFIVLSGGDARDYEIRMTLIIE